MLDPKDWTSFRKQGHQMLDDMFDYLQNIRQRPVWQQAPEDVKHKFQSPLNEIPEPLEQLHEQFMQDILPYSVGNTHQGFMGWVHGGGTPVGMLAEMLAGGLNANLGGRNQIPIDVEWQVVGWMRDLFSFPTTSSGVLTTGTSSATIIALTVARQHTPKPPTKFAIYTSDQTHGCIAQALSIIGIGTEYLRIIPSTTKYTMNTEALRTHIESDQQQGITPWLIIGTVGCVNTGSIDNISILADIAKSAKAWLHIDGAFGALGMLSSQIAPRLQGIEQADSLAIDFHKWGQVPYDTGMVLIRDGDLHRRCFSNNESYLQREKQGLAAHSPWPCDYGIDLSRGFRALKVWFTFKHIGRKQLGCMIEHCCSLANYLAEEIQAMHDFTLMADVPLNIVCFRYCGDNTLSNEQYDAINRAIICYIQTSGLAAPSSTHLRGQIVIRAAIVNHRTQQEDIGKLLASLRQAVQACVHQETPSDL